MGKLKEHPKYNILHVRVSDQELKRVEAALDGNTKQDMLHAGLLLVLEILEAPAKIRTRMVVKHA